MSDLTEALEWWEDTDKEEYDPHIETGMAAARNWHTLTTGIEVEAFSVEDEGKWMLPITRVPSRGKYLIVQVDALTVTADD